MLFVTKPKLFDNSEIAGSRDDEIVVDNSAFLSRWSEGGKIY